MSKHTNNLFGLVKKIQKFVLDNKGIVLVFALFLVLALVNAVHESFPDEYDNILGGYYINKGMLPNIGFFTHHNIGAYFLAAINAFFTQQSFVWFRLLFAFEIWGAIIATYLLFRRGFGVEKSKFYLWFALFMLVGSTYWWGQMFLSETLISYLIIPVYGLILLKSFYKKIWTLTDLVLVSILTFLSFSISLTYIYIFALIYPLVLVLYVLGLKNRFDIRKIFIALVILGMPYVIFGIYLLVTNSYEEFYFQQYFYNFNYYIYNFPDVAGVRSTNPIRYAVSTAYQTLNGFYGLFIQVKDLNLEYPFNVSLVLGNLLAVVYLIVRRRFWIAGMVVFVIIFSNTRSEPLNIKETDFHATVFIALTLFNLAWASFEIVKKLNKKVFNYSQTILLTALMIIVWIYVVFAMLLLADKFGEKVYAKYMGQQPLIYDRPEVAPILNKITTKDDFVWVGPFAFHELLYLNAKNPSKYHWFLPQSEAFGRFKEGIINDLTIRRPKVIVFEKGYTNFGKRAEEWNYPITDFLSKNYFSFEQLSTLGYVSKASSAMHFDFTQTYYFDNNRREEIINDLVSTGLIEKIR